MDPYSRVREEDTSYRNETLPKTFGHLLQDHVTNEVVRNTIRHGIGPYEDLITSLRKLKIEMTWSHHKINRTCKDDPTGHGTWRKKERQTEKETGR